MAYKFEKLTSERINNLPLVLAGPVLRRVNVRDQPDKVAASVTVWLALKSAATVKLSIHDTDDGSRFAAPHLIAVASKATVPIGANLHIIAITARLPIEKTLHPGVVYFYDLSFETAQGTKNFTQAMTLDVAEGNPVVYSPRMLPSFSVTPASLASLRLIQGSCRKPHGPGRDALPMLDDLIATSHALPNDRPHQLFLTGDQIYADDVADTLLPILTDVGDALLGWTEHLPANPTKAADYPARSRELVRLKAGLTSNYARSHLLSFGEWLAMYLMVWSPVLWPTNLVELDDVVANLSTPVKDDERSSILADRERVQSFRKGLESVRRALAHVPVYMIFDDHEITDDWNMSRMFCDGVYGSELGRRVIQNGLLAYALCQHWGNCPEQFEENSGGQKSAGKQILDLLFHAESDLRREVSDFPSAGS